MFVRFNELSEEQQIHALNILRDWKLTEDSKDKVFADTTASEVISRFEVPRTYTDIQTIRETYDTHEYSYVDYVVYEDNEVIGFIGYKFYFGGTEHPSETKDLYIVELKSFDIDPIIEEMFDKSHWVHLPFYKPNELVNGVDKYSRKLLTGQYVELETVCMYGRYEIPQEPEPVVNPEVQLRSEPHLEITDKLKEIGVFDIQPVKTEVPDNYRQIAHDVWECEDGGRIYKNYGVVVSIDIDDELDVDTYVYPPTEEQIIKSVREVIEYHQNRPEPLTTPTGTIHMSHVNTELGHAANRAINLNQSDVRALAQKPTASSAITMNDLRNKAKEFTVTAKAGRLVQIEIASITSIVISQTPYVRLNINVNSGTFIHSNSTSAYALYVRNILAKHVHINFNAGSRCVGRGGNGGAGGSSGAGGAGGNGGGAIFKVLPFSMTIASGVVVSGGGGGGGGGGAAKGGNDWARGGGGGGGRGGSAGGAGHAAGGAGSDTAGGAGGAGQNRQLSSKGGGYNVTGGKGGGGGTGNGGAGAKATGTASTGLALHNGGAGGAAGVRDRAASREIDNIEEKVISVFDRAGTEHVVWLELPLDGKEGPMLVDAGGSTEITYLEG
ncbi:hypothetical protein V4F87_003248 [Vibrio parahaemolyticus]|nr:hypothetical protein [Vibrio parahaemolyticus]